MYQKPSPYSFSEFVYEIGTGYFLVQTSKPQIFSGMGELTPRPTPNLEDQSPDIIPRGRVPGYTPGHWVPILVAFYDMHGLQWDYSTPVTTRGHEEYIY